ncbi:hypothetical protein BGY98DRAFT_561806 [Russula aff. rugulosa BPL654]|nr:hypothetical protein BGY98DRAFT_561806 [Russula aff. rugulosa BPL654]
MTTLDSVNGTACNIAQYQQSLQSYLLSPLVGDEDYPSISCLTAGDRIGLALIAEASFISSISVVVMFFWIGWNVRWYRKTFPKGDWKLFQRPADIYVFSLFVFDIVQAIGGALNIRWAHNGIITTGGYCTAQGITQQIGEAGVAQITLILAVHTFVAALWQVGLQARGVALGMVCLVCVFITLCVAIGAGIHMDYIVPTYWCWINPEYGACALVVYSSGCGSHYLLRQYYTSHYISGLKVACLSMNGAGSGFTLRTPI